MFSNLRPEFQKELDRLREKLDRDCKYFIKNDTRYVAANYGTQNVPGEQDVSIEPSIESIRGFFMRQNTEIALELQGAVQHEYAAMNINTAKNNVQTLKDEAKRLADEKSRDSADMQKIQLSKDKKSQTKIGPFVWGLAGCECIGYTLAFLRLGDNFLLAIVWGVLVGLAQTLGIKTLVIYLRDHLKTQLSTAAKIGIIAFVGLVAWALGMFRYLSVTGSTNPSTGFSSVSFLMFMVITLLLLAVVAGLTYIYSPTEDEMYRISEHNRLEGQNKKRDERIEAIKKEIAEVEAHTHLVSQMHRKVNEAAKDMHKRMQAFFKQAIGEFKLENRIKRTDGITPACFNAALEPLRIDDEVNYFSNPQIEQV